MKLKNEKKEKKRKKYDSKKRLLRILKKTVCKYQKQNKKKIKKD